jgi:cytochrome c553
MAAAAVAYVTGCSNDSDKRETAKEVKSASEIVVTEGAVGEIKKSDNGKENSGQFYYSYNKERKRSDYNAETSEVRTELDAYRAIRSPYERVQITLMVKQLSADYRLLCSACHDDYANGVIGPALLDKNASYIYDQIIAFKTGKKKNVLMEQLVNRIEEKRLRAIAEEIERFNKQILEMRSKR